MTDLSVRIGSLTLANPVMPASGTFAEGLERVKVTEYTQLTPFMRATVESAVDCRGICDRAATTPTGTGPCAAVPPEGLRRCVNGTAINRASCCCGCAGRTTRGHSLDAADQGSAADLSSGDAECAAAAYRRAVRHPAG